MNKQKKRKIIIDTDPGHDDALALLLLLQSQEFDVQAVTTVAGNASIEKVTRNAQAILNLVHDATPVYSGYAEPVNGTLVTAVVHGESGLDGFDTTRTNYALTNNAPQKIVEIVQKFPGEVAILTLGPLSNIARALQLCPRIAELIPQIIMMGGAISVPGNKNRTAEFNFFVDPFAADIVFQSDIPKVLIPLDACNEVVLQVNDFQKIKNLSLQQILIPMMQHFTAGLSGDEGVNGILVYDALAAYYLLRPKAFAITPMNIQIETKGEHTFGMTVAERRPYKKVAPNTQVVTSLNQTLFRKDLFSILGRKK